MEPKDAHPPTSLLKAEAAAEAPEAKHAERVMQEVVNAPSAEKRKLAIDQKILIGEVQLLLAEKRTSFALLRTGVTVSLVPLSMWTVLLATSRLWNIFEVLWVLVPLMVVAVGLFILGISLVLHALSHLRHTDRVMTGLRQSDTMLESLMMRHEHHVRKRFVRLSGATVSQVRRRVADRGRGRGH